MELNEISNGGKLVNTVIIIVNVVTYITYFIGMWAPTNGIATLQTVVRIVGAIIAVAGIVYTIILLKNSDGRIKGLGLCLAGCIVSMIFSIIGLMLGLVIWIICGISIKQLDSSFREAATTDSWDNYAERNRMNNAIKNNQSGYNDPNAYGNQGGYGYNDPNAYGNQGGYGYNDPNTQYGFQQPVNQNPIPQEPKVASHPNGFGVQEEPEIDFSDL